MPQYCAISMNNFVPLLNADAIVNNNNNNNAFWSNQYLNDMRKHNTLQYQPKNIIVLKNLTKNKKGKKNLMCN